MQNAQKGAGGGKKVYTDTVFDEIGEDRAVASGRANDKKGRERIVRGKEVGAWTQRHMEHFWYTLRR